MGGIGVPFQVGSGGSVGANVNVSQISGTTASVNNGTSDAGTLRVTIASDSTGQVKLAAGANAIGSVTQGTSPWVDNITQVGGNNISTGSGIMGTGVIRVAIASDNDPLIVKQATAANLNATVVGTGTFVVQATLAAETTKVIGTVNQGTSPWVANATLQTQTDTIMVGGVNIKEINAITPLMGNGATGTGSLRVTLSNDNTGIANWGHGATGSAVPAGAQYQGAQARSSEISAATNANLVGLITDLVGKLIVLPYANPENFVNGTTAAITDTTTTSVIAAEGAGVRTYITQITVTNSHATVGTFVKITDGASTILHEAYAAAAGGGFTATFPTPLRGTANTAVNAICVTTGSNVIASVSGFKGI